MRGPIVLCKTGSFLLCILEQWSVDNSLQNGVELEEIGPISLRPSLDLTPNPTIYNQITQTSESQTLTQFLHLPFASLPPLLYQAPK